jgi:hypothetical protein
VDYPAVDRVDREAAVDEVERADGDYLQSRMEGEEKATTSKKRKRGSWNAPWSTVEEER